MSGLRDSRSLWQEWLSNLPPMSVDKVVALGVLQKVGRNPRIVIGCFPPSVNSLNLEISYCTKYPRHFGPHYTFFHLLLTVLWGSYDCKQGKLRLWEISSQSHKRGQSWCAAQVREIPKPPLGNAGSSLTPTSPFLEAGAPAGETDPSSSPLGWSQSLRPLS